jgi:hypothetical protein
MKFELIEERELTAEGMKTTYYTEMDGSYVSNSLSSNKDTAQATFNELVKLAGAHKEKKVLITEIVKENK